MEYRLLAAAFVEMNIIDILIKSGLDPKGFDDAKKSSNQMADAIKTGIGIDVGRRIAEGLETVFKTGIEVNAMIEQQTIAFETLLKSADAAQGRVAELYDFAAHTPFEFNEVLASSRVLEAMTKGALASADGLRIVGDVASGVARPLRDVDMWIGRVYAGLKSGTPIGEATLRLIEMGAITGDQARKLNELAESGNAMGNAMEVVQQTFSRFAGSMEKQSRTMNGQVSTLKDNFKALAASSTVQFFEALKASIAGINTIVGSSTFQSGMKSLIDASGPGSMASLAQAAGNISVQHQRAGGISGALGQMSVTGFSPDAGGDMSAQIARFLRTKRDHGEMDEAEIERLTKKLALIRQIEPLEERSRQLQQMAIELRGGKPRGANTPPMDEADIEAAFSSYNKELEKQNDQLNDFYAMEADMEQKAMEETEARLARETEDLHAFNETMQMMETERIQKQQQQTQRDQDALRVKRDELNLKRVILDADFRTADVEKKSQRMSLLQQEIDSLTQLIQKLEQRRDLESDASAREALNQQVQGLGGERRQLLAQQAGMRGEADPFSLSEQMQKAMTDLRDQWGTVAEEMANSFKDVMNSAISTISNGITGLIMGTLTWGEALRQIGMTILSSIINAIVTMGIRWIATQIMMAVAGKALQASMVAANAPLAAASAAIWATPATLATIASYGGAAAAAPAFIAASEASVMASSMLGFKDGGYTGDGDPNSVAGVAHRGEFYFTAPQTAAIGRENLASLARTGTMKGWQGAGQMMAAAMTATAAAATQKEPEVNVVVVNNKDELLDVLESTGGRARIVNAVKGAKLEIGINT